MAAPTLYILMRTDMASMNPGRAMAQAAHAANQFVKHASKDDVDFWSGESHDGFGVTVVLSVGSLEQLQDIVADADSEGFQSAITIDNSYMIRDGAAKHFAEVATCGYVYVPDRDDAPLRVKLLNLHP